MTIDRIKRHFSFPFSYFYPFSFPRWLTFWFTYAAAYIYFHFGWPISLPRVFFLEICNLKKNYPCATIVLKAWNVLLATGAKKIYPQRLSHDWAQIFFFFFFFFSFKSSAFSLPNIECLSHDKACNFVFIIVIITTVARCGSRVSVASSRIYVSYTTAYDTLAWYMFFYAFARDCAGQRNIE